MDLEYFANVSTSLWKFGATRAASSRIAGPPAAAVHSPRIPAPLPRNRHASDTFAAALRQRRAARPVWLWRSPVSRYSRLPHHAHLPAKDDFPGGSKTPNVLASGAFERNRF